MTRITAPDAQGAMMESGARDTGGAEAPGASRKEHGIPPGAVILVKNGFYEGLEVCVDRDWLVVGRGRSADLMLAEPTISRSHAAIGFDAEGFFVQDLGSTNGTMVNGGKAPRSLLKDGDIIQMGKLTLGVTLPG